MKIAFVKMHGCGNDFVLVDGRSGPDRPWKEWAPRLLDRRFGIGGDQLLVLLRSDRCDVGLGIFERDGRESEMCGNGIRCVARFLRGTSRGKERVSIDTLGGVKVVEMEGPDRFRADMGKPIPDPSIWGREIALEGENRALHSLSMGNPHAVLFVPSIGDLEKIGTWGPLVETDPLFPSRTNVELVFVRDRRNLAVRVWERGAGETFACGTGASASAVAAIEKGLADSPVNVHFRGGTLTIAWEPGASVFMTGPATEVFRGEVEP